MGLYIPNLTTWVSLEWDPDIRVAPVEENSVLVETYQNSYVRCNIIHNIQDIEMTKVLIDRWMDKYNAICTHVHTYTNGILFSHKSKNADFCDNMKLKDIILSAINQTRKDEYVFISFVYWI